MVLLTGIFVLYFLFLVAMLSGWKRAMNIPAEEFPPKDPLMSIVIPVRNEELTISNLLRHLSLQEYRNFEIIIVNDDSEDETLWMVDQSHLKNLTVIHNPGKGKKAAIAAGVRAARGSIIVTTDADCTVSPQWLTNIRVPFRNQQVMMSFGGVRIEGNGSFFDSLQAMEFASLIGVGGATAALGSPTMCNGANLAFRKKVFLEVKGFDDNMSIPSGDDEFLMRKIRRLYPDGIRFVSASDAVVSTRSQPDREALLNQRIRWASKWKYNSSRGTQVLAVVILIFQAAFIANWFYFFTSHILQSLFLIVVKMILEAAFLLQVCSFLRVHWNWLAFFALQAIYPLYAIGVGVTSFFRTFEWKHRSFRPY